MIRVIIAEDQALVLGALAALLKLEPDLEVAATASNGKDALDPCRALRQSDAIGSRRTGWRARPAGYSRVGGLP